MGVGKFDLEFRSDGKLTITVVDTGTIVEEWFGEGASTHEMLYTFDKENLTLLKNLLMVEHPEAGDSLEELLKVEFGECLEKNNFRDWLKRNSVEYGYQFWTDYD